MAMRLNIQLTKQQQQMAALGVVILGAFTYSYVRFFWAPYSKRISEDREETGKIEQKIAAAKREKEHLGVLEKELESLDYEARDAEKRLPKTRDLPTVFDAVNRLARLHHVELASFAPGGLSTKPYFIEIPYQIAITGRYHDVGRFLASVSLEERIYNLKDVVYAVGGSSEDKSKLNVSFTLVAYQYKG